ncbi:Stc1 domain-containing protein [Triangularia verruculosa]|uniref:Stc1 domain-containing protein n=1 Tax=Triangularia verruculosa TaxID=2587418 RepID=A0AAN6X736_9PEZI|nr:Stc1 domain-containing protein [Triangularia verruculosa]
MSASKIRCESGGEWNDRSAYSQSALRKYQKKIAIKAATPTHSTISCIRHSAATKAPEMQCEGPCDKFLPLDSFSKSSRRNKRYWCKDCTDWTEKSEVGEYLPPPGTKIQPGEFDTLKTRASQFMLDNDYENGIPIEGMISAPSVIVEEDEEEGEFRLMSAGSESGTCASAAETKDSGIDTNGPKGLSTTRMEPPAQAPHWFLGALNGKSSASATPSTPLSLDTLDTIDTLEGAMSELSVGSGSQSKPQTVATTQTATTSVQTNTTGVPGQRGPVSFNAWGPGGEHLRRVKQPTVASEDPKVVVRTAKGPRVVSTRPPAPKPKEEVRRGGWVKVSKRRTEPTLPDYLKYDSFHGEEDLAANLIIDEA